MSQLKAHLDEKSQNGMKNTLILGDAGYPLSSYLITPFRSAEPSSQQANFNYKHTQGRIIIEQTIGLLKNIFRCLLGARELAYKPKKATTIINSCAALHNYILLHGVEYELDEINEGKEFDEPINEPIVSTDLEGEAVRNELLSLI